MIKSGSHDAYYYEQTHSHPSSLCNFQAAFHELKNAESVIGDGASFTHVNGNSLWQKESGKQI